jgi:hypothetical protein
MYEGTTVPAQRLGGAPANVLLYVSVRVETLKLAVVALPAMSRRQYWQTAILYRVYVCD